MSLRAAAVLAVLLSAPARADVIFEEPTPLTCGRSDVIVAAKVEVSDKPGPFTNGAPPSVKTTATECYSGCKTGDSLDVSDWADPKPSHSGKPSEGDAQKEEAQWRAARVVPPEPGRRLLLFLRREGVRLLRVHDSGGYGGYVLRIDPSEKEIQRAVGMCRFAVGFDGERDRTAAVGKPIPVRFQAVNIGKSAAPFHGEDVTLKLQTDTRPGEDLFPERPVLKAATLTPGAPLTKDWDLTKLFPGAFVRPGHYWLTLDGPGHLGLHWLSFDVN